MSSSHLQMRVFYGIAVGLAPPADILLHAGALTSFVQGHDYFIVYKRHRPTQQVRLLIRPLPPVGGKKGRP